jgi:hypothetical protein
VDLQSHNKDSNHLATDIVDCNMDNTVDDGDLLCTISDMVYRYGILQAKYNNLIDRVTLHNARMNELIELEKSHGSNSR